MKGKSETSTTERGFLISQQKYFHSSDRSKTLIISMIWGTGPLFWRYVPIVLFDDIEQIYTHKMYVRMLFTTLTYNVCAPYHQNILLGSFGNPKEMQWCIVISNLKISSSFSSLLLFKWIILLIFDLVGKRLKKRGKFEEIVLNKYQKNHWFGVAVILEINSKGCLN